MIYPVSESLGDRQKPGFCENLAILTGIWLRNPVSESLGDRTFHSQPITLARR
ncbi:hypothetical protein QUB60_01485 [Microcoleus sp. A2-C5]|uniref:hypothetical protein n=1 Tax=Microcoleaceae TaxID=1892252 RepID=UPI0022372272|nr:hypothetical protein [Lyngbya sp. CCAP 1446/10]MCW6052794.1 hypothetical protein [Lyngbya sp. CCAP 1446/10]